MLAIGFTIFALFVIGLELFTGFAMIGWTGDYMVVEREKSPGPFWFTIILHMLVGFGLPLLIFFAG
ncbi:MAG: hypothetical protein AAF939_13760 [Planctomycetota bacterium]